MRMRRSAARSTLKGRGCRGAACRWWSFGRQVPPVDTGAVYRLRERIHEVGRFAHIARPDVGEEPAHGLGRDGFASPARVQARCKKWSKSFGSSRRRSRSGLRCSFTTLSR